MIAGEGTVVVQRDARSIYEFILDFDEYKRADHKIGTVYSVTWRGAEAEVCYAGRLRGFPTPAVRQIVSVEPHRRIEVRSKPGTLAHSISRFHGLFTLEELTDGATRLFHREELEFAPPLRWLLEPLLKSWLEADTPEEVLRLKELVERPV